MIRKLLAHAKRAGRATTIARPPILHRNGGALKAPRVVVIHRTIGREGGMPPRRVCHRRPAMPLGSWAGT